MSFQKRKRRFEFRKTFFDPLAYYLSKRELLSNMKSSLPRQVYLETEQYKGRGFYNSIASVQMENEIVGFSQVIQDFNPRIVVEIGTKKGGTLYMWARTVKDIEHLISIDLPGGKYGAGYNKKRIKLYKLFVHDKNCRSAFIRKDSHKAETLTELQQLLRGEMIDFLFIDGDHTYEGVKQDFEMYSPLVKDGGIIALHDIVTETQNCGVKDFWQEINGCYKHKKFIDTANHSDKGIALIYK